MNLELRDNQRKQLGISPQTISARDEKREDIMSRFQVVKEF